jgi:hypothetical protein
MTDRNSDYKAVLAELRAQDQGPEMEGHQRWGDEFYMKNGPCCSGCDWWHSWCGNFGECRRAAIVPDPWAMIRAEDGIVIISGKVKPIPGHPITMQDHHCGEFRDEFDWHSLGRLYLKKIGYPGKTGRPL